MPNSTIDVIAPLIARMANMSSSNEISGLVSMCVEDIAPVTYVANGDMGAAERLSVVAEN